MLAMQGVALISPFEVYTHFVLNVAIDCVVIYVSSLSLLLLILYPPLGISAKHVDRVASSATSIIRRGFILCECCARYLLRTA
jgi:hypothetical protein